MTTYNASSSTAASENILELRDETEEPRGRAYSQELVLRNDQSELLETRTVASHIGGFGKQQALSQYVYQQSVFNEDDLTESEQEDEEISDRKSLLK